jgi:hypothetical protein
MFNYQRILFPIHDRKRNHWILAEVTCKEGILCMTVYDSIPDKKKETFYLKV